MFEGMKAYLQAAIRRSFPATREEFQKWQTEREQAKQQALKEQEQIDRIKKSAMEQEISVALADQQRREQEFEVERQKELAREEETSRQFIEALKQQEVMAQEELRLQAILRGPGWIQRACWAVGDIIVCVEKLFFQVVATPTPMIKHALARAQWFVVSVVTYRWWIFWAWESVLVFYFHCTATAISLGLMALWQWILEIADDPPVLRYFLSVVLVTFTVTQIAFSPSVSADNAYVCIRKANVIVILNPNGEDPVHPESFAQCRHLTFIPRRYSYGETVDVPILGSTEQVCVGFDLSFIGKVGDIVNGTVTETTAQVEAQKEVQCLKAFIQQRATKLGEKLAEMNNKQPFVELRSHWQTVGERQVIRDNLKKEFSDTPHYECPSACKRFYAVVRPYVQVVGVPVYQ